MLKVHKLTLLPDFKDFNKWLRLEDAQILKMCLRYYLDIDTKLQIGFFQVYVLYVNFVIKIKKNLKIKKKAELQYNTEPISIKKEIAYLYYHYNNLNIICELLSEKYYMSKYKDSNYIVQEFKNVLKDSFKKLNDGQTTSQ